MYMGQCDELLYILLSASVDAVLHVRSNSDTLYSARTVIKIILLLEEILIE